MVSTERALVPQAPQAAGFLMPAATVQQAVQAFDEYQKLKSAIGTPDDFVEDKKTGRKRPRKSFVRKVERFFGLSCEILKEEPLRDDRGDVIAWLATARAIHLPTGTYQDGDGACSMSEKTGAISATIHNIRAHAVTRAKNRAILDLVGFGDVSAEEINDGDDRSRQAQAVEGQFRQVSNISGATPAQLKAIYVIGRNEHNLDDEGVDVRCADMFGRKPNDLTKREASEFIDSLQGKTRG